MKSIELSQGYYTVVDNENYDELSKHKWYCKNGYAVRNIYKKGKGKTIHMHRVINNTPVELQTDHIDGNPLNNQKSNLRTVSNQENMFNRRSNKNATSRFKGVSYHKLYHLWQVTSKYCWKKIFLGYFKNEIDAAITYNNFAIEHHGECARLNVVETDHR